MDCKYHAVTCQMKGALKLGGYPYLQWFNAPESAQAFTGKSTYPISSMLHARAAKVQQSSAALSSPVHLKEDDFQHQYLARVGPQACASFFHLKAML